jgi:hypothetical protein
MLIKTKPSQYRHCLTCRKLKFIHLDSEGNSDMTKYECEVFPAPHFSPDDSHIHTCKFFESVFSALEFKIKQSTFITDN